MPKLVFLATDVALYVLVAVIAFYVWHALRTPTLRQTWRSVLHDPAAMSAGVVLFRHVLRNALIPILTGVVVVIPTLFMGSLLTESFFGVPGLGSYTIDAINAQDFAVVRSMVFVGSALYIVGLILTDISYTVADPRIRLS